MAIHAEFNKLFEIMGSKRFLSLEGLGKEVPFFIHAYEIRNQRNIYIAIGNLQKRLKKEKGIETALVGLYDLVVEYFLEKGELEDVFKYEKENSKQVLLKDFTSIINPEEVIIPYFKKKREECNCRIMMVYQVGEVFPYLRTHIILNTLQSQIKDIPLVVFFPGEYIMSKELGFSLNLFGKFPGPYYRAFKLEDYLIRSGVHD